MKIDLEGSSITITFDDLSEFVDFCAGLGLLLFGGADD